MGRSSGGGGGAGGGGGGFTEVTNSNSGRKVLSTKPYMVAIGGPKGPKVERRIIIEKVNDPLGKYEVSARLSGFDRERRTGVRSQFTNTLSAAKKIATGMANNVPDNLYKLP